MNAKQVSDCLLEITEQIIQTIPNSSYPIAFVGIQKGGDQISRFFAKHVSQKTQTSTDVGTLDITLYRDDAATSLPDPKIGPTHIPFEIDGRDVVLVDDVLHTGRTVRAALDCLLDHGRPRRIWLAALLDRGQRELPFRADFVGKVIDIPKEKIVKVSFDDSNDDQVTSFYSDSNASQGGSL